MRLPPYKNPTFSPDAPDHDGRYDGAVHHDNDNAHLIASPLGRPRNAQN